MSELPTADIHPATGTSIPSSELFERFLRLHDLDNFAALSPRA